MKSTIVTGDGQVKCPECGAVNSFTTKRTAKGKLLVGVAAPKRLKCNGCGANLKRGEPPRPSRGRPSTGGCAISFCKSPAAEGSAFCLTHGSKVRG